MNVFNIYCDESCHLENDCQKVMVLGAVWCPQNKSKKIFTEIRDLKKKHKLNPAFEIKWTKVSKGKFDFYKDVIDLFFDSISLRFRALIVPDKSKLRHEDFQQNHDDWYYKMYFNMLKTILNRQFSYFIYLDIKDTRSSSKIKKLHNILCNNIYDFPRGIIRRVQPVRSHEVEILQITDLLIGAISYLNRGLSENSAKAELVSHIQKRSGYDLSRSTLPSEKKFNIFSWNAYEAKE